MIAQPKASQGGLTLLQWNKGNAPFLNRMEDIVTMLETHKPQLFGISEANIHPNAHTPSMNIPGYSLETDRLPLDKFRGQVAIYVTKDIKYKRRLDLEPPLMPMIWLEVEVQKEKNILINIGYREWTQQTSVKTKARGKKKRNNEERSDSLDSKKVGKTMMKQKERLNTMIASWEKASLEEKPLFIMGDWNINSKHTNLVKQKLQPYSI